MHDIASSSTRSLLLAWLTSPLDLLRPFYHSRIFQWYLRVSTNLIFLMKSLTTYERKQQFWDHSVPDHLKVVTAHTDSNGLKLTSSSATYFMEWWTCFSTHPLLFGQQEARKACQSMPKRRLSCSHAIESEQLKGLIARSYIVCLQIIAFNAETSMLCYISV